jgi:excisionase family DNA binding protein
MDYLTVQEVAESLRITTRTVMTMIESGSFPNAFKAGEASNSPWRIPKADVEQFIQRRQRESIQK